MTGSDAPGAASLSVTVDRGLCCGAAQCVVAAPEVFDQGEDGLVVLLDAAPPAALLASVLEAEDACPSRSITVESSAARPLADTGGADRCT